MSMRTLRDRFKHRSEMEEDLFIRRNLTKEERKALASHKRAALSGGMLLEDLADDITGIIQVGLRGPSLLFVLTVYTSPLRKAGLLLPLLFPSQVRVGMILMAQLHRMWHVLHTCSHRHSQSQRF
jgi:hypothetical protein